MTILVSVVIPTYRRPNLLQRCLSALAGQTLSHSSFEIIVVDDGDCEQTRDVIRRFSRVPLSAPVLRYTVAHETQGPAAARNKGWRMAAGGVIAFTDDDTIPEQDWLTQGLKALTPDLAAVTGRVVVPVQGRPTDFERMTQGLEDAEFVTANLFIRRKVLQQIQGFDERFQLAWREDSDLQFRLLRSANAIGRAREALVLHPARPAPWGVSLRQQRNVFYDALLYKKHPEMYRHRIRRTPPLRYYAIVLGFFMALASLVTRHVDLGLGFLLLSLLLCLEFAWERLKPTSRAPRHVAEMVVTSFFIPFLSLYWRVAGALHFRVLFL